jgi:hypothetical protein
MGKKSKYKPKHEYTYIPQKETYFHHSSFSLEIRPSQIKNAGMGVYTSDAIPNRSFIDYYVGDLYKSPMSNYFIEIEHNLGIDAIHFPRCYMAMINDSYQSQYTTNCEFIIENKTVSVYSIRDIQPGEELFISYGDQYWK